MTDSKLVERLRAAQGASRELDGMIWREVAPGDYERKCGFWGMKYAGHVHTKAEKAAHIKHSGEHYAPAYTASLDAAMTLYPANMVSACLDGIGTSMVRASLGIVGYDEEFAADHASPAIATCLAALLSRTGAGE